MLKNISQLQIYKFFGMMNIFFVFFWISVPPRRALDGRRQDGKKIFFRMTCNKENKTSLYREIN